ncbi:hypothetical protein [Exiguobacterium sp. s22]|uniref:hypothetical protein n=1 Tax=Exiguobacterium sp. s22 TaxID=2751272 RepID=UPI001BEC326A|nr:hypothetical protein [Exiguobacterium sp. s22]
MNENKKSLWTNWKDLDGWICESFNEDYINLGRIKRELIAQEIFSKLNETPCDNQLQMLNYYLASLKMVSSVNFSIEDLLPVKITVSNSDFNKMKIDSLENVISGSEYIF